MIIIVRANTDNMKLLSQFLLLLCFASCSEQEMVGVWTILESSDGSVPVERHEAAFTKVGDKFFLLGGRGVRPVSIYDTKVEKWSEGAAPPFEIHHFQPVVIEDKIYILGAFTGGWPNETPIEHVMIYDPKRDNWSAGHTIPKERRRGAAGASLHNGKVYVSCGLVDGHIGNHQPWLDEYNPKTGEWKVLSDAPRTRDHFNSVVAGGKLYLTAGRNTMTDDSPFSRTIGEVDVYDFESKSWSTLPNPIPTRRAGNAAVLYQDEVVVIGGESDTQELAHKEVEALNVDSHNWRSLPPLNTGRHGTGAVLFEGGITLASGCGKRGGEPELKSMESFSYKQIKK